MKATIACHPGYHRHPQPPRTGCAFPDARRANGRCNREPVAVYVNPYAKVLNTYRCERHDSAIAKDAASDLGFRRLPLDTKAARVAQLNRMLPRGDCE